MQCLSLRLPHEYTKPTTLMYFSTIQSNWGSRRPYTSNPKRNCIPLLITGFLLTFTSSQLLGLATLFADKGQITANKVSLQTKLLSCFLCTITYLLLWCDNAVGLALKAPPSHSLLSVMLMIGKFQVTLCKMCSNFRPADKGSDTQQIVVMCPCESKLGSTRFHLRHI